MSLNGIELAVNVLGPPGSGKTTLISQVFKPMGFSVFRGSDMLRSYAQAHDLSIRSRTDYARIFRKLRSTDPEMMTRSILERDGLVAIDGLRNFPDALYLKATLGERFKTAVLVCPPAVCLDRIIQDGLRCERDSSVVTNLKDYIVDLSTDMTNADYQLPLTMTMHDLTANPIDTSPPAEVVAHHIRSVIHDQLAWLTSPDNPGDHPSDPGLLYLD